MAHIMTFKDLRVRDEAEVRARQQLEMQARINDDGGVSNKQLFELSQRLEEAAQKTKATNEKWKSAGQRADKARMRNSANNGDGISTIQRNKEPQRIPSPAPLNDPNIDPVEEDKCCLCNRVCLFGLIGSCSTACIIALIAGLIFGSLGALIGFCSGVFIGGLLGVIIIPKSNKT